MREFFALQPSQVDDYWPWIENLLLKIDQDEWTPETVKSELKASKAQLWGIPGALWITKIEEVGEKKRGVIWICAGEGLSKGLYYFKRFTEPWLREQGCTSVQIIGRRGWMRVLSGYKEAGTLMVKHYAQ